MYGRIPVSTELIERPLAMATTNWFTVLGRLSRPAAPPYFENSSTRWPSGS